VAAFVRAPLTAVENLPRRSKKSRLAPAFLAGT
jgi:hypothetical protein